MRGLRACAALALLLTGCAEGHRHDGAAGHGHPRGAEEHGDHGHGDHGASEVVTRWGTSTQLFVEFPALVAGEDSAFAAHLTLLEGHAAVDAGSVVVELSGGDLPVERFSVDRPATPGIFRPVVRPAHPGRRRVTVRLEGPAAVEVHPMGQFTVFPSRAAADAAPTETSAPPDGVAFLLEQQWRVPFGVEQVEERSMRPNIPAFARLTLPNDAEAVITAPRAGRIMAAGDHFPLVGEPVAGGAVLFALGTAPQEAADPTSLTLAMERAGIRVEAARREVRRLAPLVNQGVVAQRRLDGARSALSAARAELRGARRRVDNLGGSQRLGGGGDQLEVPSPLGGAVAEMFVAPGAWVTQGQRLARVVARDRLWLDVGVPEAWLGRLGAVSGAWFEFDGVAGVLEVPRAALVSIGAEVDPVTRTLPVRFRVDNTRGALFAGMTTLARLITDAPKQAVAVPISAVVDDGGVDVVFVQTGGESFTRQPVRLGVRDGAYVEVLEGVAPGEWVVARGPWSVKLAATSTASIGHGHAH